MSLKYKKFYVDTKYKTPDSVSNSNFSIELPEVMVCPSNCVMYLDDISIPYSWTTIEPGLNSRFYMFLVDDEVVPSRVWSFLLFLSDGNYIGSDLAVEIQNKINSATNNVGFTGPILQVSYSAKANTIKIETSSQHLTFYILTPSDLKDKLGGLFTTSYDVSNPRDCNEVLGNLDGYSPEYGVNKPFISGYINMAPIRNIYMHSSSLGTYQTVALRPNGYDNTVIKHIPVNSNFNEMIYCDTVVVNDWLDCSGQTLKKIDIQLKTSRGDIIPLHVVNMSFSLVFAKANSDY